MTQTPRPGVQELSTDECWRLLADHQVGRLAVDVAGQPDIFPINYVVHDQGVLFRSAPGTKLAGAVLGRKVAFEIDGYLPAERVAWSVVVKGVARLMENMHDRFAVEDEPLFPWVAFPKPDFVLIAPTSVTGRRFEVVESVDPDDSLGWETPDRKPSGLAAAPEPGAEHHPGAPRLHAD